MSVFLIIRVRFLLTALTILFPLTAFPRDSTPLPTTRKDPAGKLLNQWFVEGTASGNLGDYYDNRDRRHSQLNLGNYAQLRAVPYTKQEIAAGKNYGPASSIHPFPVIGNASLSAPATKGGSLARITSLSPGGLGLLSQQYVSNQLYVYPEHQDHDPGLNGHPGYGDLYPFNTPFLIISQGSSGSDQPFLNALALTLASFQPAVKEALVKRRMLSPTLQYIFRMSNKPVASSRENYLSGIAHPTVFRNEWIDESAMMRRAHEMTIDSIPPLAALEITGDNYQPTPGEDFFEPKEITSEYLANAGVVIARVFRGKARTREMRVKVAQVLDTTSRPVRCEWCLLRGDPNLVSIVPSASGMEAVVRIAHHPELIPAPGTPEILSSRVDIGVFADNGVSLSPPSFLCFYMLPNEYRYYPKDGSQEPVLIDYQALSRETDLPPEGSMRWGELLRKIWENKPDAWLTPLLRQALSETEQQAIDTLSASLSPLLAEYQQVSANRTRIDIELKEQRQLITAALKKAKAEGNTTAIRLAEADLTSFKIREKGVQAELEKLAKTMVQVETKFADSLRTTIIENRTLAEILDDLLVGLIRDTSFFAENRIIIESLARKSPKKGASGRIQKALDHLVRRGVITSEGTPAPVSDPEMKAARRYYLETLNRLVLSESIFPTMIDYNYGYQFSDERLTQPQREVYTP